MNSLSWRQRRRARCRCWQPSLIREPQTWGLVLFRSAVACMCTLTDGLSILGLLSSSSVPQYAGLLCPPLCLIIEKLGPQLIADKIFRLWIIPVWGLFSTASAHFLGSLGHAAYGTPYWLIVVAGRPNTSALPLLLLESLESTGIVKSLSPDDSDLSEILDGARSLIILNVVIQQTITYQLASFILRHDGNDDDDVQGGSATLTAADDDREGHLNPAVQDTQRVGLSHDADGHAYGTNGRGRHQTMVPLCSVTDQPDIR